MTEIVLTIATTLSMTPMDVYVLFGGLIFWIVLVAIGIQKTYEVYFGLVVGLAIYLMLTVLLSPQYQTADTAKILSPGFSQFLIGSSAYLIFILMILTPLSGGIRFPQTRFKLLRGIELMGISIVILSLFGALVLGFANKTYIFGIDTGFVLLKKISLYPELIHGKILGYIVTHIQPLVVFSVLFLLYKILFSEIVGALVLTVWYWIMSLRHRSKGGNYDDGAGHDDHGGGHDDGHGDLDFELGDRGTDHGGHDDHGGGHDDGHGAHH